MGGFFFSTFVCYQWIKDECVWIVPPNIADRSTSDGVMAREGSNVSLSCQATGYPQPNITWKREDGSPFTYNGQTGKHHRFNEHILISYWNYPQSPDY